MYLKNAPTKMCQKLVLLTLLSSSSFSAIGSAGEIGIGYADFQNDRVYNFSIVQEKMHLRQCAGIVESQKSCVDAVNGFSIPIQEFIKGNAKHGNYTVTPKELQRAKDAQDIARRLGDDRAVANLQINIDALTASLRLMDQLRAPLTLRKLVFDDDFKELQAGFLRAHRTYFGANCFDGLDKEVGRLVGRYGILVEVAGRYHGCNSMGLVCIPDTGSGELCRTLLRCDEGSWYADVRVKNSAWGELNTCAYAGIDGGLKPIGTLSSGNRTPELDFGSM